VRVKVDLELCHGHGQCEDAAPEIFFVTDEGYARLRMEEISDLDLQQHAKEAADRCPTRAILLSEFGDDGRANR